jgi:hypothetical protein
LFEKKSLPYPDSDLGELAKGSKLSQQIENYASLGENPFLEYAKFDGRVCRKYQILAFNIDFMCLQYFFLNYKYMYMNDIKGISILIPEPYRNLSDETPVQFDC